MFGDNTVRVVRVSPSAPVLGEGITRSSAGSEVSCYLKPVWKRAKKNHK